MKEYYTYVITIGTSTRIISFLLKSFYVPHRLLNAHSLAKFLF